MEKHEEVVHGHKSMFQIFITNFVGGIAWGLGASVGVSILVALSGFLLTKINLIPIIGDFINNLNFYLSHGS